MPLTIKEERPDSPDAVELIMELEGVLAPLYPAASRHGYSVQKLIDQGVLFYVARQDGQAAGCAGVQLYGADYGELKRMYVRPDYRGLGIAKQVLAHIENVTREHGASLLRLETGIYQTEAVGLYRKWGFRQIDPFGEYFEDPLSMCFEKKLG